MRHPNPARALYLGMRSGDLEGQPYAKFWNPNMAELAPHVREALLRGPAAPPLALALADAGTMLDGERHALENGFVLGDDGSMFVAVNTEMPDVSPEMVDFWFGWHGSDARRYKLWHPRAHVHVQWGSSEGDDQRGRARYVGRVSFVDEYLGGVLRHAAIRFVRPSELGFDEARLADATQATAVCARIGLVSVPVDAGFLVHHVRRVPGGAEMRSRFWMGGAFGGVRGGGVLGPIVSALARRAAALGEADARALLVHCAEEMTHLASFLPRLYAEMGEKGGGER